VVVHSSLYAHPPTVIIVISQRHHHARTVTGVHSYWFKSTEHFSSLSLYIYTEREREREEGRARETHILGERHSLTPRSSDGAHPLPFTLSFCYCFCFDAAQYSEVEQGTSKAAHTHTAKVKARFSPTCCRVCCSSKDHGRPNAVQHCAVYRWWFQTDPRVVTRVSSAALIAVDGSSFAV